MVISCWVNINLLCFGRTPFFGSHGFHCEFTCCILGVGSTMSQQPSWHIYWTPWCQQRQPWQVLVLASQATCWRDVLPSNPLLLIHLSLSQLSAEATELFSTSLWRKADFWKIHERIASLVHAVWFMPQTQSTSNIQVLLSGLMFCTDLV